MDTVLVLGVVTTALGLVGYAVGVAAPYPGRAFSVAGVMVGVTLVAVGAGESPELDDGDDNGGDPQ